MRHSTTATPAPTPSPTPPPSGQGVTIQAEGGAMLYGKGGFEAPNVAPGQERLDEGGALRFVVGQGAYAAEYDANGNMTSRVVDGQAQVLEWDAENRLVKVTQGASVSTFLYDGDGNRVQATVDGASTVYIGNYYEQTGSTVRTYYYHAGQRVAMREAGVTTWLFGDHLGSTSVAYRQSDGQTTAQRYYAWGTIRPGPENALPTDHTFTGQKLDAQSGLLHYGARWYDPMVGRFLSADSIVPEPGNPQDLNRFVYVRNNPLRFVDPTGHMLACDPGGGGDGRWVEAWRRANGYKLIGGELVYTGNFTFTDPVAAVQGARQFAAQGNPIAGIKSWTIEAGPVSVGIAQRGTDTETTKALGVFAMTMDVIDLASAGCYAVYSTAASMSSEVAGPEATAVTVVGAEAGWKVIGAFTNFTDALGVVATSLSDYVAGRTGVDPQRREAYIGLDTVVSIAAFQGDRVGRLIPAPIGPHVTAAFSTAQVVYDGAQLGGYIPSYSLQVKW